MISKEEFIERAEATMTAINKFNEVIDAAEMVLGGCFDNINNTGVIRELINCLATTIEDKNGTVRWAIDECKGMFPIKDSVCLNGKLIDLEGWDDVYDLVQEERHFDDCATNGGVV